MNLERSLARPPGPFFMLYCLLDLKVTSGRDRIDQPVCLLSGDRGCGPRGGESVVVMTGEESVNERVRDKCDTVPAILC